MIRMISGADANNEVRDTQLGTFCPGRAEPIVGRDRESVKGRQSKKAKGKRNRAAA